MKIPTVPPRSPGLPESELVETIRGHVIGHDVVMEGPFGPRRITYADYTASGRALEFVEQVILQRVLPAYANTHTESSGTGLQTTRLREEARSIIAESLQADDDYVVIFAGSGATGAIDKMVACLEIRIPADLDSRYGLSEQIPAAERPIVFVGPYEHHSNELPWRESIADVVTIGEDADGHVDQEQLRQRLIEYADRPLKIGSFSAASNVTGIKTDTGGIASLLHQHGALSFWDYAAAAPYVSIRMTAPEGDSQAYKDAVFLSVHKFVGGPSTPGVLAVRRELLQNSVPAVVGGGTVAFVNPAGHEYLSDPTQREEGGTPGIVEAIRAGLVFQLKQSVGSETIEQLEADFVRRAIAAWGAHDGVEILGSTEAERLSIVSFTVRSPRGNYLHHNFVVAVLNDLFGIQSRGGCSCAGPYGHRLLGIDIEESHEFEREIDRGCEGIKPGWTRVNFNYFLDEEIFTYIIQAVGVVASLGHRLLPYYKFDPATGLWVHEEGAVDPPLSMRDIKYVNGIPELPPELPRAGIDALPGYLAEGQRILEGLPEPMENPGTGKLSADFEALRWFELPPESLFRS